MSGPKRIQMRRSKGWRKPAGARYVGRPTRWGNPFVVGEGQVGYVGPMRGSGAGFYGASDYWADVPLHDGLTAAEAVELYRDDLEATLSIPDDDEWDAVARRDELRTALVELRGHDLACWCPLDQACHSTALLELANQDPA